MDVSSSVSSVMASVHRRTSSPYYHAAFRGPDGRLILRSTKQTDRSKALAVALEFDRAVKLAKRGELVEAQAREVINDIMKRADTGEKIQTVAIGQFFREWLSTKEARRAKNTSVRYESVVDQFLDCLGNRATKALTTLSARDIDVFLNLRTKQGVAPRTAVFDVKVIRSALNSARRKGLITTNPAEAVELPDVVGVERGTFNPVEIGLLMSAAEGEWKTLILFAYYTGARLSDCCRAEWAGIDLVQGTFTHTQGKTGQKVTVPLHPDLLTHLEALAGSDKPSAFIMPGMANLKSGGRHGLSEGFKRVMRKAGLDLQTVQGAGVRQISKRTFHALRHSFTSALANAGVSSEVRMKLTGHTTEAVHRGYTHHEIETLRNAVAKIPSLVAK